MSAPSPSKVCWQAQRLVIKKPARIVSWILEVDMMVLMRKYNPIILEDGLNSTDGSTSTFV